MKNIKRKTVVKIFALWLIIGFIVGISKTYVQNIPLSAAMDAMPEPIEEEVAFQIIPESGDEFIPESDPFVTGADRVTAEQPAPLYYAPAPVATVSNPILSEGVLVSLITTIGTILNTLLLIFKPRKKD